MLRYRMSYYITSNLTIDVYGESTEAFKNTPPSTLLARLKKTKYKELRGLIDAATGDVYWADADKVIHVDISRELDFRYVSEYRLTLTLRTYGIELDFDASAGDAVLNNPHIAKLLYYYSTNGLMDINDYKQWGLK